MSLQQKIATKCYLAPISHGQINFRLSYAYEKMHMYIWNHHCNLLWLLRYTSFEKFSEYKYPAHQTMS